MRTAAIVKANFPNLPICARARNRTHAHRLLDLGITNVNRETFLSSLSMTKKVLMGIGISDREAERMITTFRAHDERRLNEDYKHFSDLEKLQERARSDVSRLEALFAEDTAEAAAADARAAEALPKSSKKDRVGS